MMANVITSCSMDLQKGKGACGVYTHLASTTTRNGKSSRRNSIPPTQSPKGKHLLAYLPRPLANNSRYSLFLQKPETVAISVTDESLGLPHNNVWPSAKWTGMFPHAPVARFPNEGRYYQVPTPMPSAKMQRLSVSINKDDMPHYRRVSMGYPRHSGSAPNIHNCAQSIPPRSVLSSASSERSLRHRCKLMDDDRPIFASALGKQKRQRYVMKDGKCNVNLGNIWEKKGFLSDIFTTIVDLKYRWFLFIFTMCYIVTWVLFAILYLLTAYILDDISHHGEEDWEPCLENVDGFVSALLFSVESQRTIGYGTRMVTSNCVSGLLLLMAQSVVGSMIDAMMVGCMFVKISRPKKRAETLKFSKYCVVSHRDKNLQLMFRLGDLRESHMVDAKIRAKLIKSRHTEEGEFIPLEQSEISLGYDTGEDRLFLVEPQIICHHITNTSPFWELRSETLSKEQFEIIVILEGIVESTGMTCQARTSYTEDEILWGHRFESCITMDKGAFKVDYSLFDKTFELRTQPGSAKDMEEVRELEVNEQSTLSLYWDHLALACPSTQHKNLDCNLSTRIHNITEEMSDIKETDLEI